MDFINATPGFITVAAVLVLLVAVLLWYGNRRRRRLTASLVGEVMAGRLTSSLARSRRRLRSALLLAALLCLGVAAARPWWGYRLAKAPPRSRDILVAVDCSRSMLAEDVSPSRLAHAKWWLREVVAACPGDRFGLIAFAGTAFLECPLTPDRNTLFQFLDDLDTTTIPVGGTNIEKALTTAGQAFKGAEGPYRAVVLISDGGEQQGDAEDQLQQLRDAAIPLFAAGIGTAGRAVPIRTEEGKYVRDAGGDIVETALNERMLRHLATATAGMYVRSTAITPNAEAVVKRILKLVPHKQQGTETRRPRERYQVPLSAAVLLLMLRMALGERRRRSGCLIALLVAANACASPSGGGTSPPHDAARQKGDTSGIRMEELTEKLAAADGEKKSARLAFNLGVLKHKAGDLEQAESLYLRALERAPATSVVASRAAQNLGALKQQQADRVLSGNPDQALDLLDRAEAYNLEALHAAPRNEAAARNQERLQQKRQQAERLKQLKKQMEKRQKAAEEAVRQAEEQQKGANQTPSPADKRRKQRRADRQTDEARKATETLEETAREAQDKQTEQRAQKAGEALDQARRTQRQGKGTEAEEHLREARRQLDASRQKGQKRRQADEQSSEDGRSPGEQKGQQGHSPDSRDSDPADIDSLPELPQDQGNQTNDGQDAGTLPKDIDPDVARALLLQMLEEEEDLREAIKGQRARQRKRNPVEKDW